MIYAILELNNKQFIIKEGDKILIDHLKHKPFAQLILQSLLLVVCNKQYILGYPYINNYKAYATIVNNCIKGKKIHIFKKNRRKGYHKKIGHRQLYTKILINKIIKI